MKTLLLENWRLANDKIYDWVKNTDLNFKEISPDVQNYMKSDDLFNFTIFINPELENIFISSGLDMGTCYDVSRVHPELQKSEDDIQVYQFSYYTYLLFNAIRYRARNKMKSLNIHLNYYGDFIEDIQDNKWGEQCSSYIKLMLRQQEENITIYLYDEFKLIETFNGQDGTDKLEK